MKVFPFYKNTNQTVTAKTQFVAFGVRIFRENPVFHFHRETMGLEGGVYLYQNFGRFLGLF